MKNLILHSLKMHKVQTVSVLVTVALSIAMCLTLGFIYCGVMNGIELSDERSGSDIMVIPESASRYVSDTELLYTASPAPIYMDKAIVDKIAQYDGVEAATPQFFSQTLNKACCSSNGETRLIGIDLATDFIVTPLLDKKVTSLAEDEVIVGCDVTGITDGVMKILDKNYKVVGTMAQTGAEMDSSIIMDIDVARAISAETEGYDTYWEKFGQPQNLVSCVMVKATDDEDLYKKLTIKLNLTDDIAYIEQAATADTAVTQLRSVFLLLAGVTIVMIIITLLQLFARFYSCVWDRKAELALYRAIGADKATIKKLILGEIGLIMGAGAIAGIIIGFILSKVLVAVLMDAMAFPFVGLGVLGSILLVVIILVIYAVIAFAAVIWPLKQIGRLDPSLAMQQGDVG